MTQLLHIANGDTINDKLGAKLGRLTTLLAEQPLPEKIIEDAYVSALARLPTAGEKSKLVPVLAAASDAERRPLVEDLYWAVLSSREFLFNH